MYCRTVQATTISSRIEQTFHLLKLPTCVSPRIEDAIFKDSTSFV